MKLIFVHEIAVAKEPASFYRDWRMSRRLTPFHEGKNLWGKAAQEQAAHMDLDEPIEHTARMLIGEPFVHLIEGFAILKKQEIEREIESATGPYRFLEGVLEGGFFKNMNATPFKNPLKSGI